MSTSHAYISSVDKTTNDTVMEVFFSLQVMLLHKDYTFQTHLRFVASVLSWLFV